MSLQEIGCLVLTLFEIFFFYSIWDLDTSKYIFQVCNTALICVAMSLAFDSNNLLMLVISLILLFFLQFLEHYNPPLYTIPEHIKVCDIDNAPIYADYNIVDFMYLFDDFDSQHKIFLNTKTVHGDTFIITIKFDQYGTWKQLKLHNEQTNKVQSVITNVQEENRESSSNLFQDFFESLCNY